MNIRDWVWFTPHPWDIHPKRIRTEGRKTLTRLSIFINVWVPRECITTSSERWQDQERNLFSKFSRVTTHDSILFRGNWLSDIFCSDWTMNLTKNDMLRLRSSPIIEEIIWWNYWSQYDMILIWFSDERVLCIEDLYQKETGNMDKVQLDDLRS